MYDKCDDDGVKVSDSTKKDMKKLSSPDEVHASEEEERVRQNPAPPLWDENVEECFIGKSYVFSEGFQFHVKAWVVEKNSPNLSMIGGPMNMPLMHFAANTGDLPLLRALGRYSCNLDYVFGPNNLTPLHRLIVSIRQVKGSSVIPSYFSISGGKPNAEVVEWLLSRGVNIHIKDSNNRTPFQSSLCNLKSPATRASLPIDLESCKLLLLYGADRNDIRVCKDKKVVQVLHKYIEENDAKGISRPPFLCPCGNNVRVETCHGSKEGVPVHRRMLCPCKRGRIYEKCCFKKRYYFRETLKDVIAPPRIVTDPSIVQNLYRHCVSQNLDNKHLPMHERESAPLFPGVTVDQFKSMQNRVFDYIVSSTNDSRIDPCFLWCAKHPENDF